MISSTPYDWLSTAPLLVVGAIAFGGMLVAALIGFALRALVAARGRATAFEGQEGYIVTAAFGLLALLMGFTFALAVDRYETRRVLVLHEANAIGTTYLRVQLLSEPHRDRLSRLLVRYVDNRIALAEATPDQVRGRLAANDALLTDLWAATAAAFDDINTRPFANALLETMNNLIDLDAARKAARRARVPGEVFAVLISYLIFSAGVLAYVLTGALGRIAAGFVFVLLGMSLLLVLDIDRPTSGGIREGQGPMAELRASMAAQPPPVFDKWRRPTEPSAARKAGAS